MYARDPAEAVEVGPAADHLPAGRQSQDRQGSRSDRPALDPRPRRRGYRITGFHSTPPIHAEHERVYWASSPIRRVASHLQSAGSGHSGDRLIGRQEAGVRDPRSKQRFAPGLPRLYSPM